jgi:hypothetical protein
MDTHTVSKLAEYLRSQDRVWVRFAASLVEDAWQLALLEVITGESPLGWRRVRWSYEHATFIASSPAGATVAGWLERQRIALHSPTIKTPLEGSVSVERRESNFQGIYQKLPWPTREWEVHIPHSSGQVPHGELVAADTPAFMSFDQAAAAFFDVPLKPNRNFSGRAIVIREQDRCARIDRVRINPTEILVDVSGEQLAGVALTLSGANGACRSLTRRTREVRLPVPGGLSAGALLALHRDRELLDRRILAPGMSSEDVDVEIDATTRVAVLISNGEGSTVEFKRQLPEKGDRIGPMKTIAAFANGAGGTMLIGVADDGAIIGVGDHPIRRSLDRLTNLITECVRPLPDFGCEVVEIIGNAVILINVASGSQAPYGVGTTERDVRYYIRRAATTFPASSADVRELVQARVPASPALYFPPRGL